ncbi:MAG: NFACT family protein [Nanoarchaeota archaeon]|nr:NFACT family protein [Nanoarchaeota archaeon]MBU1321433.1 NFACT family protein [Nanoarchaeota archaeon]MBU1597059.1 NFACT family protein [Nanoarchaeota archaeon]MBU2440849.1 NFACT family protein [Nanoarchaeota archaeon]
MKQELTSLDLHYLVKEFQSLVGARIDKIYEQDEDRNEFLFIFHISGVGKQMLRIKLPELCYMTEYKQLFPDTPPGYCMFLRKHLSGARIREIRQKGFERILEIVFTTKAGIRTMICELFSKGNIVLVDEEQKIRGLLKSQNWQARTVRGGVKYEYPPEQTNTSVLSQDQFKEVVSKSKMDSIVKTLAVDFGLGGFYAEELCKRAKIDKDKKLDDKSVASVYNALQNMFNLDIKANNVDGQLVPFKLSVDEGKQYETFNKLLDDVFSDKIVKDAESKVASVKQGKESKVSVIIRKQEERLISLEKGITENQRKGESIYEHYQELKELLDNINSDRKKMNWEEVKKKYKKNKLIKSIDEKTGKIVVDV